MSMPITYTPTHEPVTHTPGFDPSAVVDMATKLRRLEELNTQLCEQNESVGKECARLEAEAAKWESEYNAALQNWEHMQTAYYAERDKSRELLEALKQISLCSQNSMSSQRECGEIAREAIAKHGVTT